MFGMSDHRLPSRFDDLERYVRGLEGYVGHLSRSPVARRKVESFAEAAIERLTAAADAIRERATPTGEDVSRYGTRIADTGRNSFSLLAKEVSANPIAAVAAAMGIGLVIGVALHRRSITPKSTRAPSVRKGSTQ
jgi:ElaB/YqjD/DUF883 family membrane-anchored ribosome-binding protein